MIYHAVSLTVLRNTLVSITVIYHAVSLTVFMLCLYVIQLETQHDKSLIDTNLLRNTVRDTA
jgi:hypothetical protein